MKILAPQVASSTQKLTWYEATQSINGSGPNMRGKYKSCYMKTAIPEDQVTSIYTALTQNNTGVDLSNCLLQLDTYGGEINAKTSTETAVTQRDSILKLQYQAYWQFDVDNNDSQNQAIETEYLDWIRSFYQSVYSAYTNNEPLPDEIVDGCYINYCDTDLVNRQYLYYKENYAKLQAVKLLWDPNNHFNFSQSIQLPIS